MIIQTETLPVITESDRLYARALGLMPPPTQVLAKGVGQWVEGVAPKFARRAQGAHLWDVDGNRYLDYSMAVGPVSLGYAHPEVDATIRRQLDDGISFSLPHALEVEVSELLAEVVPCAESVRFTKTGAEATSAAVRVARAVTGRDRVLTCGYHGWHDWYIGTLPRDAGVPHAVSELVSTFSYNDLSSLHEGLNDRVAAVILEPMTFTWPEPGFLKGVVDSARQAGALVVFDEIWTGFRWALGGAQEAFGITPDLTTISKGMANGMPIGALVGHRDLMSVLENDAFVFSTFGGEALSLAATQVTIEILRRDSVTALLAELGERLRDGFQQAAEAAGLAEVVHCVGHPARTMVAFDEAGGDPLIQKSLVSQELIRRRILWQGFHTLSAAHTPEDIDRTVDAYHDALNVLANAIETGDVAGRLEGRPMQPVFRNTTGFNTKPRMC